MPIEPPEPSRSERRLHKLVGQSTDIIVITSTDGQIRWVSPSVQTLLGFAPDDLIGTNGADLVHPTDLEQHADLAIPFQDLGATTDGTDHRDLGVRARTADGGWLHVRVTVADLSADPDIEGLIATVRDVSREVEAEAARVRLSLTLEASTDMVGVLTTSDGALWLNRAGLSLLGLTDSEVTLDAIEASLPAWVANRVAREVLPAIHEVGLWEGELAVLDAHGDLVPLSVVMVGLHEDGILDTVSLVARDISDRKAFEVQLEHQANHDPLTGLPNRTFFLDRLRTALGLRSRHPAVAAVLFLDLDNFKVINDSLGHAAGDTVLVTIAQRLEEAVRGGDTVARLSGDEFAVLCEQVHGHDEATEIAERMAAAASAPISLDGRDVTVTVSIGVAVADADQSAEALLRDADAAMYHAKARGRSRTEVFDTVIRVQAVDRLDLEQGLRRALDRHEMRTVFQPQVDLRTGHLTGLECLLRWEHPERGLLLPAEFLAVAEETGLIVPIGGWVLRGAARTLARLRALKPKVFGSVAMSVNVSTRQLSAADLVDDVAAVLAETGLGEGALVLEITETGLMDVDDAGQALERLQSIGVRVAVDDFGTGWSSLRYLRDLPVDILKIDRSFVAGLGEQLQDEAIVGAVIELAHALGLTAVAEGVEHQRQLDRLSYLGCDAIQGWLIGAAQPESQLAETLGATPLA